MLYITNKIIVDSTNVQFSPFIPQSLQAFSLVAVHCETSECFWVGEVLKDVKVRKDNTVHIQWLKLVKQDSAGSMLVVVLVHCRLTNVDTYLWWSSKGNLTMKSIVCVLTGRKHNDKFTISQKEVADTMEKLV